MSQRTRRRKEERNRKNIKRKKPQRPIFTSPCGLTIVSAVAFHCQVRDGAGWVRYALATTLFSLLLLTKLLMHRSASKNEYRNGCQQLLLPRFASSCKPKSYLFRFALRLLFMSFALALALVTSFLFISVNQSFLIFSDLEGFIKG